ncbi:MAG: multiple monosaccharide ABC transporter substrate-binding protein [Lachnospirales bacterium]
MKKLVSLLVVSTLVLTSCGGSETTSEPADTGSTDTADTTTEEPAEETEEPATDSGEQLTVGVAMPTKSSQRWIQDGDYCKELLENAGYEVDLQYGEDQVELQVSQLDNMITKGVDALIIASIDGEALTGVLSKAAENNIPVISYDRLIRNSPDVSYYATFDNFLVGVQQGTYIEEALDLQNTDGPYNIELFGGSPDDNNSYYFFDGAMSILQPYIDEGKLVVQSGQTDMDSISILRWDSATAQSRMDNLIVANYSTEPLDAVLAPADILSTGIISALKSAGYGTGDKPMPIVTGQDADINAVKSMIAGEQSMTIFKDTRILAEKAVGMVDAVLSGGEAEVNDTTTYDNGSIVVPSYLCEPLVVTIDNYEELLIDSGYYSADDLK